MTWSSSLKIAVVHDVCGCWLVCGVGEKEVRVVALVLQIFPMIDRHVSSCLSSTWSTWKQFHRLMKSSSCALDSLNHLRFLSPIPSWRWHKWEEMLSNLKHLAKYIWEFILSTHSSMYVFNTILQKLPWSFSFCSAAEMNFHIIIAKRNYMSGMFSIWHWLLS